MIPSVVLLALFIRCSTGVSLGMLAASALSGIHDSVSSYMPVSGTATDIHVYSEVPDNSLLIVKLAVNEVFTSFEQSLPEEMKIKDMDLGKGAMIAKNGKVKSLKNLKRIGEMEVEHNFMSSGQTKFKLSYSLGPLDITFDEFKFAFMWITRRGKLVSSFEGENTLTLQFLVPPLEDALESYGTGACFVYVDDVRLKSSPLTVERLYTGGLTGGRTSTAALKRNAQTLEAGVKDSVSGTLDEAVRSLSDSNKHVCPPGKTPSWANHDDKVSD